jgi:hypothetical protein
MFSACSSNGGQGFNVRGDSVCVSFSGYVW